MTFRFRLGTGLVVAACVAVTPFALRAAEQAAPQAVTYTNVGTTDQILTAVSLSGYDIGDFAAVPSAGLPVTIPPGGTFVVNVTFAPSGVGLRAATLNATFQGFAGPATTLLTGTGN